MLAQSAHGLYRAPAAQAANQSAAGQLRPSSHGNSLFNEMPVLPPGLGDRLPEKTQHGIHRLPFVGTMPHQGAVAAVPVPIQLRERCHLLGAQWIQMNVAHQLQQVRLFLAENGFVAVLKQMSRPTMQAIEPSGVAAQKLSHDPCDGGVSGSQQQVEVVGHQSPCVAGGLGFTQDRLQPLEKVVAVGVLPKDLAALDTTANDMVQSTRGIDAGSARHG